MSLSTRKKSLVLLACSIVLIICGSALALCGLLLGVDLGWSFFSITVLAWGGFLVVLGFMGVVYSRGRSGLGVASFGALFLFPIAALLGSLFTILVAINHASWAAELAKNAVSNPADVQMIDDFVRRYDHYWPALLAFMSVCAAASLFGWFAALLLARSKARGNAPGRRQADRYAMERVDGRKKMTAQELSRLTKSQLKQSKRSFSQLGKAEANTKSKWIDLESGREHKGLARIPSSLNTSGVRGAGSPGASSAASSQVSGHVMGGGGGRGPSESTPFGTGSRSSQSFSGAGAGGDAGSAWGASKSKSGWFGGGSGAPTGAWGRPGL